MIELLVIGALVFAALMVIGVLVGVLSMVGWLIALPFVLLRWTLHALAALIALPFILLFGVVGIVVLGFGAVVFFLIPALPFVLIAWFVWWLFKKRGPATRTA